MRRLLCLMILAGCTHEASLPASPLVRAGPDIVMTVRDSLVLGAQGEDPDGSIARFEWLLVSAPELEKARVTAKSEKGDVAELTTGGVAGLYVLRVVAEDDDGLRSEPDYLTVTLRAENTVQLNLACTEGCHGSPNLGASERATLTFAVDPQGGVAQSYVWEAHLVRHPADRFSEELQLASNGTQAQITVPRVARSATLTVSVSAQVPGGTEVGETLIVAIANDTDEPPELTVSWRQPGATSPADGSVVVLPGDALHVSAAAEDPNGDAVACRFEIVAGSVPAEQREGSDSCRTTLYPLAAGTLTIRAIGETAGEDGAALLDVQITGLTIEEGGPALTAVAVASPEGATSRVAAVGSEGDFHLYRGAARTSWSTGLAGGTAIGVTRGTQPERALVGFGSSGAWARYNLTSGGLESNLGWGSVAPARAETRAMSAGSSGRVFAATDQGVAVHGAGGLELWRAVVDVRAIAVGPNPASTTGEGFVWFAAGTNLYHRSGETLAQWGVDAPEPVASILEPGISTLAAGTENVLDLWVGTRPEGQESGSGLYLFADAVNAETGEVTLGAPEELFANETGVAAVAVERTGPYEGDAWVVAGRKLLRVSRAALDGAEERSVVALRLVQSWDAGKVRAVAVSASGARKVAVATDRGLLAGP